MATTAVNERDVELRERPEPLSKPVSSTQVRAKDKMEKGGNRYFDLDRGYDKRVYENDCMNICRIMLTFVVFYIFNGCHWWACFSIGTTETEMAMWYFVGIFIFTVLFFMGMLCSGRQSNRKKKYIQWLDEQIMEAKLDMEEKDKAEKKKLENEAREKARNKDDGFGEGTLPRKEEEEKDADRYEGRLDGLADNEP